MTQPFIQGPSGISRSAGPATFRVDPGSNPFYGVEVAAQPMLFDKEAAGDRRSASNFYASWAHSQLTSSPTVTLPDSAWQGLKNAHQLYYRAVTSQSQTGWVNYVPTTRDDACRQAPFMQVIDLFLSGLPAESPARIDGIWMAAQQHSAIQHVMSAGEYGVSVYWHTFSPRRPLDQKAIELLVVASSYPQHKDAPVHIGLVRLDYLTLSAKSGHAFRDLQRPTDRQAAWTLLKRICDFPTQPEQLARQGDLWLLSALRPSPTAHGGTALVHTRTGTLVYLATTHWQGREDVLIPQDSSR
ncbi:MAG: hypothetical protein WBB01_07605 [Phormidesmis sp.]